MYVLDVKPWRSSKWEPPEEGGPSLDDVYFTPGARGIRKEEAESGRPLAERRETTDAVPQAGSEQ